METAPIPEKEQIGIQADVIELPHANLVLLDSGKGTLGDQQLNWLAKQLDKRADKPALIFGHYNPYPNQGVRPNKGMRDGSSLLKILAKKSMPEPISMGTPMSGNTINGTISILLTYRQ